MRYPRISIPVWHTLPLALLLLLVAACSRHEERLRQLEQLEARNSTDSLMTDDALAEALASYFDDGGTPNERMRAHYILARTYADLGETPAALQSYLDAADAADTTAADCDWAKLSRVYGQMSRLYYEQNLLDNFLQCADKSTNCAWKAKDTLQAFDMALRKTVVYDRRQQYSYAIALFDAVFRQYTSFYDSAYVARYCTFPIRSLLNTADYEKTCIYLDLYERKSGFFDQEGNVFPGMEVYYYLKGDYYLHVKAYDSAACFFYKELHAGRDYANQNMASHGLAQVFMARQQYDSAAHYALYGYDMNDSVYSLMATDEVSRAQALYNYNRSKELAEKEHARAEEEGRILKQTVLLAITLLALAAYVIHSIRKKKKTAEEAYLQKKAELRQSLSEVNTLSSRAEKLKHIIQEKDNAILQQSEELGLLRQLEADLRKDIEKKEHAVHQLQEGLLQYDSKERMLRKSKEAELQEKEAYQRLHKKIDGGKALTDSEIEELERLVAEVLPGFCQFLANKKHLLNENEYVACLLFRLHANALFVSVQLGKSPTAITKLSKSVSRKLFDKEENSKNLSQRLSRLC
jgi:heme exporter protein D